MIFLVFYKKIEENLIYIFLIAVFSLLFLIFIVLEHFNILRKCHKKRHINLNKICPQDCQKTIDSYENCENLPSGRKNCPWDYPQPQISGKGCQFL